MKHVNTIVAVNSDAEASFSPSPHMASWEISLKLPMSSAVCFEYSYLNTLERGRRDPVDSARSAWRNMSSTAEAATVDTTVKTTGGTRID